MNTASPVCIDIWSDYVCPFCYLELPVLRQLERDEGGCVTVRWRAFELRPEPIPTLEPEGDYLRTTWDRAVFPLAELRRMVLRLPAAQPRSRAALELAAYARDQQRFDEVHEALFRAFFEEGRDIGDDEVLLQLAAEQGLEPAEVAEVIGTGRYLEQVFTDRQEGELLGITAVPALWLHRPDCTFQQGRLLAGAVDYPTLQAAVQALRAGR